MLLQTDDLLKVLDSFYPVDPILRNHFKKIFYLKQFPKHYHLVKPGRVAGFAWFIVKGAARAYTIDDLKGIEVTNWFWLEGEFVWALDSFCRRLPTRFHIQLLEDSVLQLVSRQDLEVTVTLYPQYRHLERAVTEAFHARLYRHYHLRASRPARERFQSLMERHPQLFHKASVKDIASFLGMFPDTLSRLRSER
jgi:CRP/FNR family transcriptional regulator, anaerobic regulatory protein